MGGGVKYLGAIIATWLTSNRHLDRIKRKTKVAKDETSDRCYDARQSAMTCFSENRGSNVNNLNGRIGDPLESTYLGRKILPAAMVRQIRNL